MILLLIVIIIIFSYSSVFSDQGGVGKVQLCIGDHDSPTIPQTMVHHSRPASVLTLSENAAVMDILQKHFKLVVMTITMLILKKRLMAMPF